jgi:nucleotide-binding universal stress UspA family protein
VSTKRGLILGYADHGGDDVLSLGRLLAEVLAAKPLAVTALPWPHHLTDPAELERQLSADMHERFTYVRDELHGLDPETRAVASGHAASALHELADAERAQVIVIGSCHRGPVGRTLAGSVGESLLHGASAAIAIAPRGYAERGAERLRRIAVAFDGSPEAWTALETAIGMAERCHAELTVLVVADSPTYGYAAAWTLLTADELHDAERADKERLADLAAKRIPDGLMHECRVLTGDPATVLREVSGEFDLMVTGSRSWGPLRRTMLGSTTRRLIRSAECPVLVLPRGAGVDPLGVRERGRGQHARI